MTAKRTMFLNLCLAATLLALVTLTPAHARPMPCTNCEGYPDTYVCETPEQEVITCGEWNGSDPPDPIYIYGTGGDDDLEGNSLSNYIYAYSGDDTVHGLAGNDRVYGGTGDDTLDGDSGNDYLYGQAGDDSLYGGSGDDDLDGGSDSDYLDGETGSDTCVNGETYVSCND